MTQITHTITEPLEVRDPDKQLDGRLAWRLRVIGEDHDSPALQAWVLWCPQDHPAWQAYYVTGCSLDDERFGERFGPSQKQYPEAEYEITVFALNPEHHDLVAAMINSEDPLHGVAEGDGRPANVPYLMPPNVVQHVDGITRDGADAIVEAVVNVAINGVSLDSDFSGWWCSAIKGTASHFRGEHGEVH
jgi:hypothetical protein